MSLHISLRFSVSGDFIYFILTRASFLQDNIKVIIDDEKEETQLFQSVLCKKTREYSQWQNNVLVEL